MKVAAYIRVSTTEQAEKGFSIPEQTERITKYCESRDWKLVKTYTDGGFTGANLDRPAIQRLMRECASYNIILVWKLDRLSRSQKDTLTLIEHFKSNGTAFVSMIENFDTSTPFGMAMVGILSVFAQLEREQIRERMTMGKQGRAKSGKWHGGGHAPIGYDYDKDAGCLVPNSEADQVRLIYQLFLSGMPYSEITKHMNEHYTTRYTSYNCVATVVRMLRNPVYTGAVTHKGEVIEDCHEPIIDRSTYDRVQAVLQSRKNGSKNAAGRHMLSGMVFCGECGLHMTVNTVRRKYKYYACARKYSGNLRARQQKCNNRAVREKDLNELIKREILSLNFTDVEVKKPKIDNQKELDRIESRINKLIDLYQFDAIPTDELQKRLAELEKKKKALQAQPVEKPRDLAPYRTARDRAIELFEQPDVMKTRAVIDSLIDKIVVSQNDVTIHWSFV